MVRRFVIIIFHVWNGYQNQDITPFWSAERAQEKGNHVAQRRHRK